MDSVILAKIQFGFTAGFHFLFPPTTFGLTFIILIFESLYLKSKNELYKIISSFLIKLLSVIFVLGVATGIVLEFAFGNNWSEYARTVGDVFGAPLAAEGIFAFFLESVFLGILIFGRNRVSRRVYWWSAFLVFFAAHLSGLWIIIANSWMQTPAGFKLMEGRAVLTNFFQAAFNPSTIIRFLHTVIAGWITGSLFIAGIASWYLLKNKYINKAKPILQTALIIFSISALLQLGSGHIHSVQVAETQPEKMAAFEALWETETGAPFAVFGIPDGKNQKTYLSIKIPNFLSLLIYMDPKAEVSGLNSFPEEERPPVFLPFISYHFMILFGLLFVLAALIALYLLLRKKLWHSKWFLRFLLFLLPLAYLSNEFGWMATEVGRQPWAVYKLLRTSDAVSTVVPAGNVLFSLIFFILLYALIGTIGILVLINTIKQGPEESISVGNDGG